MPLMPLLIILPLRVQHDYFAMRDAALAMSPAPSLRFDTMPSCHDDAFIAYYFAPSVPLITRLSPADVDAASL